MDAVSGQTALVHLEVPDIGDFKEVPVIRLLVRPGDVVESEQPVVTLESDKATIDVPAQIAGEVVSIAVSEGTRVSQGSKLLTLRAAPKDAAGKGRESQTTEHSSNAGSQRSSESAEAAGDFATAGSPAAGDISPPRVTVDHFRTQPSCALNARTDSVHRVYAGPSIRRLARELGVDLVGVKGSGRNGRIVVSDVQKAVRDRFSTNVTPSSGRAAATRPVVDFSRFGEIERRPLGRIQRLSGDYLTRNWSTIPHVTNFDEADITDLESFRVQLNAELKGDPKITLLSLLLKTCAAALVSFPNFNVSLDDTDIIQKKYVNIGFAVDTPNGLVVPVVRQVDRLGLIDIAHGVTSLIASARSGGLKPAQMEGGCFTVSSLGGLPGTGFTPIINAPEVAILGVSRAIMQPKWDGKQFLPRLTLPVALSWDHRAVDGMAAAHFLGHVVSALQDLRRVVL